MKTTIKDYIVFKEDEARIVDKEHLKAELVARMYVDGERDIPYIMEHYDLTRAQVHAALAYYFENQEVLDAAYQQSWAESKSIKSSDLYADIEKRLQKLRNDD